MTLSVVKMLQPICVVMSAFAYGTGVGPVLFTLLGEVFPPRAKGFCTSLSLAIRDCGGFVNLKIFPGLVAALGLDMTFCLHGMLCLTACSVVYFFLPETKGLTLTELSRLHQGEPREVEEVLVIGEAQEEMEKKKIEKEKEALMSMEDNGTLTV